MFDDLRKALRKIRGDYSKNPETSIGKGRKIVAGNADLLLVGVAMALAVGVLKFQDALLLLLYSGAPFVLDSSLFIEALPLIGRFAPKVTLLIEAGLETAAIGVGISVSAIYGLYRLVGAVAMGIPYYQWLKSDD